MKLYFASDVYIVPLNSTSQNFSGSKPKLYEAGFEVSIKIRSKGNLSPILIARLSSRAYFSQYILNISGFMNILQTE